MKNSNQLKNRVDALAPEEGPIPTDPKMMTDRQLLTAIIRQTYNRPPTAWELSAEGSSRLIEMLRREKDELPDR